ncbi:3-dehydroquinate synthase [Halalkalibacter akibai JCM 9157]|uniref:3-dehydroquinate synthase n=1 Tax=Halalkalibacter akibai (strain ATCC 43226 / DSM 21942 / CIP 109018 / JCM 9157 / 1139) TaxID=1236973 RepID=W4QR51_HALA3|nr:3-dehydroquinate synthase [Halalkalibacter akibai JCM 9157]
MIGMVFSLRVSEEMFNIDLDVDKYEKWFSDLGYKTKIPASCNINNLLMLMKKDKKAESQSVRMVLLSKIEEATVKEIPPTLIEKLLVERMEGDLIG